MAVYLSFSIKFINQDTANAVMGETGLHMPVEPKVGGLEEVFPPMKGLGDVEERVVQIDGVPIVMRRRTSGSYGRVWMSSDARYSVTLMNTGHQIQAIVIGEGGRTASCISHEYSEPYGSGKKLLACFAEIIKEDPDGKVFAEYLDRLV